MLPTLKPGDKLMVACGGVVRVGDVVVFQKHGKLHIAHRVVSVDSRGIVTRGDNVHTHDARILQQEKIIGKVVSVQRASRQRVIRGGKQGIIYARILWTVKHFSNIVVRLLSPAYQTLSSFGVFRRILPVSVKPRVVFFKIKDGVEMQLLLGRLVIGRRMPGCDKWQLRPPFRLFIDESALP
ncbi:MAG: hypothetical protein HKK66_06765 [Chlorobiaceae bacterium]|nr:hypothetical protein [Chlorobiaceae bacterium]